MHLRIRRNPIYYLIRSKLHTHNYARVPKSILTQSTYVVAIIPNLHLLQLLPTINWLIPEIRQYYVLNSTEIRTPNRTTWDTTRTAVFSNQIHTIRLSKYPVSPPKTTHFGAGLPAHPRLCGQGYQKRDKGNKKDM